MTILQGLNVVSLSVTDLDQARSFYSDVLGLGKPSFDSPEMGWIEWGGEGETHLAVMPLTEGKEIGYSTTVVFTVADCAAAVEALRARGVECSDATPVPGAVTYATFRDPSGNALQIAGPPPES